MDDPFHEVRATYKRHQIIGTQDRPGRNWYIQVIAPNGGYAYDGYWRDSDGKTAEQVLEEAKRGAMLIPDSPPL